MKRFTCLLLLLPAVIQAQSASVRVRVIRPDSQPIVGVLARIGETVSRSDERGETRFTVAAGEHRLVLARIGYAPDSVTLTLRAGADTSLVIVLQEQQTELSEVRVSATRSERRIEDDPVRVEFGQWHAVSTGLMAFTLAAGVGLLWMEATDRH